MNDDTTTPPSPRGASTRGSSRLRRLGIAAIAAVVGVLTVGGAVAMATSGGDDPPTTAASAPATTGHDHGAMTGKADGGRKARRPGHRHHQHAALTPYDQRVDAATEAQRAAAAELESKVKAAIAKYADVDAAVAAGFRPPRRADALIAHYVDVAALRDGKVLDPSAPEGLVYYTGDRDKPVLLGAFFIARRGETVPDDTGGIVVWHSHNPDCPGFFATPEAPCVGQPRMLHVWTVGHADLVAPRTGKTVAIDVTDPFGVPFKASITRAG